jgi:phosphoglycolate phosphatase-like HAD superfamily hydrolase
MDIEAGRAAGFNTIAVATGTYGADELDEAGADCVIPEFLTGRDQFLRSTGIE